MAGMSRNRMEVWLEGSREREEKQDTWGQEVMGYGLPEGLMGTMECWL